MTTAKIISDTKPLELDIRNLLVSQGISFTQGASDYLVAINLKSKITPASLSAISSHDGKAVIVLRDENLVKGFQDRLSQSEATIKYIFLGELFDNQSLYGDLHKIVKEAENGSIKSFAPTDELFLVSVPQAAEFIVRELFTYAHAKDLLLASKITAKDLLSLWKQENTKALFENFETTYIREFQNVHQIDPGLQTQTLLQAFALACKHDIPSESEDLFEMPRLSLQRNQNYEPMAEESQPKAKSYRYFYLAILPFWLLILPFLAFFLSASVSYLNFRLVKQGKLEAASVLARANTPLINLSTASLETLSDIPVVGGVFEPTAQTSLILADVNEVLLLGLDAVADIKLLKDGVFNDNKQDFKELSESLYYKLSQAQKSLGYLLASNDSFIIRNYIDREKSQEAMQLIASVRKLALNLPMLLGVGEAKDYLVLLQNNTELRPTGGFIGSFALIRFENGKLVSSRVYDVYSADGQLKGYVAPPEQISAYLGEENWYLRDSNWDPEFDVSAKRATWFLDKSLGQQVDGVIAINLNLIADALNVTGPIRLVDFGDQISSSNIFTKLQYEVEDDFFPGSRKKAHYLTAFSDGFLQQIQSLDSRQLLALGRVLNQRFQAKDLQFAFLNKPSLNSQVLGATTNENVDAQVHFVEANLGVNKVNLFVERQAKAWIDVGPNQIKYIYEITISNNSPNSNPTESTYGVYARIMANRNARFEKLQIVNGEQTTPVFPELKQTKEKSEAGVFVQIEAQTSQTLRFVWVESTDKNFVKPGRFSLKLVKQSGVEAYPVEINLQFPVKLRLTGYPSLSYNTLLNKDQVFEAVWK